MLHGHRGTRSRREGWLTTVVTLSFVAALLAAYERLARALAVMGLGPGLS